MSKGVCFTTHNARYFPSSQVIKSLIGQGRLGDLKFIQFDETLDRNHGADYFRRWHGRRALSGGLQVHKASHHFDMINWWVDSTPVRVFAQGGLKFYGRNNTFRSTRCRGCPHAKRCEFYVDMFANERMEGMYLQAEEADGYLRDGCVWDEGIDIEDQLQVQIEYANGIQAAYTLLAYSPIESQRVSIEGTQGRLMQHMVIDNSKWLGTNIIPGMNGKASDGVQLFLANFPPEEIPLTFQEGTHSGADPQLRCDLFARDWDMPPTENMASLSQAIQAVLVGIAASESMKTGEPVEVQTLLK